VVRVLPITLWLLASGCSLFATREPEPPGSGGTSVFKQPDRPDVVIENLVSAVGGMSTFNYTRCLSGDTFTFTPTISAQQTYPDVFTGWGMDSEELWFSTMSSAARQTSGHSLVISDLREESVSATERRFIGDYTLTVYHNRASQGVPNLVRGRFIMTLVGADNGLWSIREWTDISVGANPSWSDLKALFTRS
jgi:hypothetical protein